MAFHLALGIIVGLSSPSCSESKGPSETSRSRKKSKDRKPRTAIDFFCEGYAKAVAQGVPRQSLLASTAHHAIKMGGPAIAHEAKKWMEMTEKSLLAEIDRDGNPIICRRFSQFLKRTNMLQTRIQKRKAEQGSAQIPADPKKPCDALKICCEAIPDAAKKQKSSCYRTLQSAKDVKQPAWCRHGLKKYRALCTAQSSAGK